MNTPNQPNAYDLVYGDQSAVPASGVVLGGLAGVRQQLTTDKQTVQVAALHKALDYGDAGLDLILEVFTQDYQGLRWAAYNILMERSESRVKEALSIYGIPHRYEVVTVNPQGEIIQRQTRQAQLRRENLDNGVTLDMVLIPGGTFLMGSPNSEPHRQSRENPQHQVTLTEFWMSKYPVTQAQYQAIMDNNPSRFKGDNCPVESVSWHKAVEFCDRLFKKLGQSYTLPSEAQWEYACRAGTSTPFHFGETITTNLANYKGYYTYGSGPKGTYQQRTNGVGSFPPNGFGLYDMHGNVWEWCLDQYHENYRGAPTDGSAWVTEGGRILRGGSWDDGPRFCRCAYRLFDRPGYRDITYGFRVVSVPPRALNTPNQPNAYDLVYGNQSAAPASGVVLGGLIGVRQQLTADNQTVRVTALHKALDYGDAGLDLILEVFTQDYQWLSWAAYDILIERPESRVKEALSIYGIPHRYEVVTVNPQGEIIQRQTRQAQLRRENLDNGVTLDMVLIPGGTFLMGSPKDESDRNKNEGPQHQVSLEPFVMGRYPVTQAQWQAVMRNNPSRFKGDNRPVEQVSWHEAMKFCDRLSRILSQPYTLPSEAQWEYACRAGTTTPFHFGETLTTDLANYDGSHTYGSGPKGFFRQETTKVDSFPPNGFGLYDMHSNVREWCLDQYHENYRDAPTDGSAWMTGGDSNCYTIRGGSWNFNPRNCRSAYRFPLNPDYHSYYIGFRVVSVPPRAPL